MGSWPDLLSMPCFPELRGLAEDSLHLLREALCDERFPALFSLEVYGSIIGMFELNNLGVTQLPCQRASCTRKDCRCSRDGIWRLSCGGGLAAVQEPVRAVALCLQQETKGDLQA